MVKKKYQLVSTKRSQQHMKALSKYISQDSPDKAKKVIEDIMSATKKSITDPEFYNPDKYKTNNDVSYRAFEKYRCRIAYRFTKNISRVLRVRHTKLEPKAY